MNGINFCFFISNMVLFVLQLILIYSQVKKTSANAVICSIAKALVNWVAENINPSPQPVIYRLENDPSVPPMFGQAIDPFNALPLDNVSWRSGGYSRLNVPSLSISIIPKNGTADFPLIRAILESIFDVIMAQNAISVFRRRVIFKSTVPPSGWVCILYGTTDSEIEAFDKQLESETSYNTKNVIASVAPVADEDLEEDLDLFAEDDKP